MSRFYLILSALWLLAALAIFSRDGDALQQCLTRHGADACFTTFN